jgi:hypothetical protein
MNISQIAAGTFPGGHFIEPQGGFKSEEEPEEAKKHTAARPG